MTGPRLVADEGAERAGRDRTRVHDRVRRTGYERRRPARLRSDALRARARRLTLVREWLAGSRMSERS